MKPTKKKSAKRNPIISKLLDLKYRINDAYRSGDEGEANKNDKSWVIARIRDIRDGMTITKGELMHANNLWNDYNPSRRNNWEDSHSRRDNV